MTLPEVTDKVQAIILDDTPRVRDQLIASWTEITKADDPLVDFFEGHGAPGLLTLKYVLGKDLRYYSPGSDVTVSEGVPLTWGRATYVTPVTEPFSTLPYGRAGVGIWLSLGHGARIFDARDSVNRALFSEWARYHYLYDTLLTTVHSNQVATEIRDHFAESFDLTAISFHPDDGALGYTTAQDTWLAVYPSDAAGLTAGGVMRRNDRLIEPKHVVIAEEDFTTTAWPMSRVGSFALRRSYQKRAKSVEIARAYAGHRGLVRVQA